MTKLQKKEDRVRFELVQWFSYQWPNEAIRLVGTFNESKSRAEAMYKRGMGLSVGLPDLMLIHPGKVIQLTGMEIKAPGSVHKRGQIEKELSFGKKLMESGDWLYFMTSDMEMLKKIATRVMECRKTFELVNLCRTNIKEVEKKLKSGKGVKF